jgi:hypothetical protein
MDPNMTPEKIKFLEWALKDYEESVEKHQKNLKEIKLKQQMLDLSVKLEKLVDDKITEIKKLLKEQEQCQDKIIIIRDSPYLKVTARDKRIEAPSWLASQIEASKADLIYKSREWTKYSINTLVLEAEKHMRLGNTQSLTVPEWEFVAKAKGLENRSARECTNCYYFQKTKIELTDNQLVLLKTLQNQQSNWIKTTEILSLNVGEISPVEAFKIYKKAKIIQPTKWSNEELLVLKDCYKIYGNEWSSISKWIDGKNEEQCRYIAKKRNILTI